MDKEPSQLADEGKAAFAAGRFAEAAEFFQQAANGFTLGRDGLNAAEMGNNRSVALLKAGKAQAAFESALGTDKVFEGAADIKRQAMALGNQGAALEALKRIDEALELYERSADLFAKSGKRDMQSMVLKTIAGIRLRQGRLDEAGINMLGSLGAAEKPTLTQRFMRFLLRFKP